MTVYTRFNRRCFLQATAAGAAALAVPGAEGALASSARSPVTLEYWNPATDTLGKKIIGGLVKTFNDTIGKSNGIVVRDRSVPDDSYYAKYTTAMTSTGSPDIISTYSYSVIPSWAANGFIQPMDSFAGAVGIKQSDYFPMTWKMLHVNGHIYGLMQEFDFDQFFWNTAIHQGPPPTTIAELDTLAARYVKFDKGGNLVQAGIVPWSQGTYTDWAAMWGAHFYDFGRGKWTINTPQNRKFLEWFLKYVHMLNGRSKSEALISSVQSGFSGEIFFAGKTAFATEGEWAPPAIVSQAPKLKYKVAHLPTAPGVPYGTMVSFGANMIVLPTKSPHPREAAIFAKYLGSSHAVAEWCTQEGNTPPVKSTALSAGFLHALPYMKTYIAAVESSNAIPTIPSPAFPVFDQQMNNAVDEVTYLKKTPAQALAAVDQKVATAVQQFKQYHPTWPSE